MAHGGHGGENGIGMDIRDRADLDGLLRAFYAGVLDDPLLARIFVDVAHMDLEEHLPAIGDFWEKVLFNTAVYNGRAMEVHRRLHRREPLTAAHFDRWVQLWGETVDARHDGPVAELAKAHAARFAVAIERNLPAVGDSAHSRPELTLRPTASSLPR